MKYKKIRYEKILNQLNLGPNMEVAHYMERSWGVICYPLLYTKTSLTYDALKNNAGGNNSHSNQRTNPIKMDISGIRPVNFARNIKKNNINIRNPRVQNYLRSLWLRRNFFRKRINRGAFIRRNRNFFRF